MIRRHLQVATEAGDGIKTSTSQRISDFLYMERASDKEMADYGFLEDTRQHSQQSQVVVVVVVFVVTVLTVVVVVVIVGSPERSTRLRRPSRRHSPQA